MLTFLFRESHQNGSSRLRPDPKYASCFPKKTGFPLGSVPPSLTYRNKRVSASPPCWLRRYFDRSLIADLSDSGSPPQGFGSLLLPLGTVPILSSCEPKTREKNKKFIAHLLCNTPFSIRKYLCHVSPRKEPQIIHSFFHILLKHLFAAPT